MRAYERTHPWIAFQLDLRRIPYDLWLLLGEAQSKIEHIAGVPLQPDVARELHALYLAKGALATTAIEGNTLSEREVLDLLEGRLELPPSKEYLAREVENIVRACQQIADELARGPLPPLTSDVVMQFNSAVLAGLPEAEGVEPGRLRRSSVGVARYRGAPWEDCEFLLARLCEWIEGPEFAPPRPHLASAWAILRAVVAHLYLAWIHPFGDGNGRTARLVEFRILAAAGFPTPAIHLLSNHYNQTRAEYYRQLDYASTSGGDIVPFVQYAVRGFVDGLRQQVQRIRGQVWTIVWRDYVNEHFEGRSSESDVRRRRLVLALSRPAPVPLADIPRLTPDLAAAYARKTSKTLVRDLNAVVDMKLVERAGAGYRATMETILAFLPLRRAQA